MISSLLHVETFSDHQISDGRSLISVLKLEEGQRQMLYTGELLNWHHDPD